MGLALSVIECQHCYDKPKVRKNQERFAKFTVYSKTTRCRTRGGRKKGMDTYGLPVGH